MPHRRRLAVAGTAAIAAVAAAPAAAQHPGLIPTVSKIRPDGIGAFKVGMTQKQARKAAGLVSFVKSSVGPCVYWDFGPPGTGQGPYLRFHGGKLRYVDVGRKQFKTKRGVQVGDRVRKVRRKYNHLHRREDLGGGYEYVIRFKRNRLIFTIVNGRVSRIAGGTAPWALWQECS
jgi:hypothetical protein